MYVYLLKDPRIAESSSSNVPKGNNVRYVGITKNIKKRLLAHLCDARRQQRCNSLTAKSRWLLELEQEQLAPIVAVKEVVDWKTVERGIIWFCRHHSIPITNLHPGGGGCQGRTLTETHKLRIGISNTGKKRSYEMKKRQSIAMSGRRLTKEHKDKIRDGVLTWRERTRKTTEQIIDDFQKAHGNRYNYSAVLYEKMTSKVEIICYNHGMFLQTPELHINGRGCPACAGNTKSTTAEFIQKANNIHLNTYCYDLVDYISAHTKVKILCYMHGVFEQTPSSHLSGCGCKKCGRDRIKTRTTQ